MKQPEFPARVFYDGACSVCAAEIEHYRRRDRDGKLIPVDISAPDFDPGEYHLPLTALLYELHVIDRKGDIYRGVEAFWAIWQAFPASPLYGVMGALVTAPLLKPAARLAYRLFARIRPYLPGKPGCAGGACKVGRRR